jgi:hypothetical protein
MSRGDPTADSISDRWRQRRHKRLGGRHTDVSVPHMATCVWHRAADIVWHGAVCVTQRAHRDIMAAKASSATATSPVANVTTERRSASPRRAAEQRLVLLGATSRSKRGERRNGGNQARRDNQRGGACVVVIWHIVQVPAGIGVA